jgi:hypothetical protein
MIAMYAKHTEAYIVVAVIVVGPAKGLAKVVALLTDNLQLHEVNIEQMTSVSASSRRGSAVHRQSCICKSLVTTVEIVTRVVHYSHTTYGQKSHNSHPDNKV